MKDRSSRTLAVRRPKNIVLTSAILLVAAVVLFVSGMFRFNAVVAHSSTPVGTTMNFKRSSSTAELKGIYTDKDRSAMIARIGIDPNSQGKLPSKGTDYKVFVASPSIPGGVKEIDVLFGRLGTDGDMFLVLPKPTDTVYTVFIMNTNYLASADQAVAQAQSLNQDSPADITDEGKKSITESMSQYKFDPKKEKDGGGEVEVKSDTSDIISFRMTLDPAFHNEKYNPILLNTQLMDANGDFNYKGMFDKLFKESAYAELSRDHDRVSSLEDRVKKSIEEYQSRLRTNPNDATAASELDKANRSVDQLEGQKSTLAKQLNSYEKLTYDNNTFANVQTKAKVVDEGANAGS